MNWVTIWSHRRDIFIIYYIQYVGELPRSESANLNLYKTKVDMYQQSCGKMAEQKDFEELQLEMEGKLLSFSTTEIVLVRSALQFQVHLQIHIQI